MKRIRAVFLWMTVLLITLCGCGRAQEKDKVTILCTSFPAYDWVIQLTADIPEDRNLEVLGIGGGQDLHFYQPSVEDVVNIKESDLIVAVGGSLDPWVLASVEESKGTSIITMMEAVQDSLLEEEIVEGMEAEEEEDEAEAELDEHVWMSLQNAGLLCEAIEKELERLLPEDTDILQRNLEAYKKKLSALDSSYRELMQSARHNTILVADRFPFRYLVEEYGIQYYAAFPGCSSETDASFETVIFLANKIKELGLRTVFITEGSRETIADSVYEAALEQGDIEILNAMQIVPHYEENSYLSIMQENYKALEKALIQ